MGRGALSVIRVSLTRPIRSKSREKWVGKKGWKTRGGQLVSQANATGVSSTGLSVLSPLHHLPLVSIFILSLVAPALRNVWEESLEDSSNLDGGASVQPRIGVIPICNRWIVASFSRFNDTRFGGIETGLLSG